MICTCMHITVLTRGSYYMTLKTSRCNKGYGKTLQKQAGECWQGASTTRVFVTSVCSLTSKPNTLRLLLQATYHMLGQCWRIVWKALHSLPCRQPLWPDYRIRSWEMFHSCEARKAACISRVCLRHWRSRYNHTLPVELVEHIASLVSTL